MDGEVESGGEMPMDGAVTRVNANTYDLNGSAFLNAYGSGGTAKPHIFESTDLGRLVRIQHASTWGYAKITAYASAVSVTADVLGNFRRHHGVERLAARPLQPGWRLSCLRHVL